MFTVTLASIAKTLTREEENKRQAGFASGVAAFRVLSEAGVGR